MLKKVGFAGCPGTGKSSTSRALAAACRRTEKFKQVELVPEYARRYLTKFRIENLWEQVRILEKQVEWEESVPIENLELLITDAPIFLQFSYALELRNLENEKDIMLINDIFKRLSKLNHPVRYDYIFYLPPKLKAVVDGIRPKSNFDEGWRNKMDLRLRNTFELFPPKNFVEIQSIDLDERVKECLEALNKEI